MINHDFMGVLVMNHYQAAEPVVFAGLQRPSFAVNEFALYEARYCEETEVVEKNTLLASWQIADLQWGQLIARPGFNDGLPVTLLNIKGINLSHYDAAEDNDVLRQRVEQLLSADPQLVLFLKNANAITLQAVERGKPFTKADVNKLTDYVNMFQSYRKKNEEFDLTETLSAAAARANEALHDLSQWARTLSAEKKAPLSLPTVERNDNAPTILNIGLMNINVSGSGNSRLFNDDSGHGYVSLTLCSASPEKKRDDGIRYSAESELYRVQLSPLQYAKLVRGDQAEIPCTLIRRMGKGTSSVPSSLSQEKVVSQALKRAPVDDQNADELNKICGILNSLLQDEAAMRKKQSVNTVSELLVSLNAAYEAYIKNSKDAKTEQVAHLLASEQKKLCQNIDKHTALLPEALQEQVKAAMASHVQATLTFNQGNKK